MTKDAGGIQTAITVKMAVSNPESRPLSVRMSRAAVVEVEEEEKLEEEEKQPLGGSITTSPPTALLVFSCVKDTWI